MRYEIISKKNLTLTINMPEKIIQDIVLRSVENGNTVEIELALRLARSLERDFDKIFEDNQLAIAAFEKVTQLSHSKRK